MTVISMTTNLDEFDKRVNDLVERENECEDLFKEIKSGNGENALRYLALRDTCKDLRKGIIRSAMTAGLTRESIKMKIKEAKTAMTVNVKQTKKIQQNQPIPQNTN